MLPARLWLVAASLYLAIALGLSIARTAHQEQDAAYYCEVVGRHLDGHGFTSLADRRGPGPPTPWPQEFRAANYWPHVLAIPASVTGEVERTGAIVNLLGLIGTLWLVAAALRRGLGVPATLAAVVVVAMFTHKVAARAATLPETDAFSLLLNAGCVAALLARRPFVAVAVALLACAVRFQNVALVFPLLAVLGARWPRASGMALFGGIVAGFVVAGAAAFEGLGVFVDPFQRGSAFRTLRFLFVPAVVGLWLARHDAGLRPFVWLAVGHLLVILANPDPTSGGEFLFGGRHGLPLHVTAAAGAAVAIARTSGAARIALSLLLVGALADNLQRPMRDAAARVERTAMPSLEPLLGWLREHPSDSRIVLSWDADVVAHEAKTKTVHLRGFPEVLAAHGDAAFVHELRRRGVTHVVLTWMEKDVLDGFNRGMDRIHDVLADETEPVVEFASKEPKARTLLLRMR